MADRYDKLLKKYFTGGLDIAIKMREEELRHSETSPDENVGGGRAKNKRSYSVESMMMKIESDDYLNELTKKRDAIKACVNMFNEEHKEVFYQHYRNRMNWEVIADRHHIDESTARRWRNDLKALCSTYNIFEDEM